MFNVDDSFSAIRTHGVQERAVVDRTENTYWPLCKMFQQALNLYVKTMPHVTPSLTGTDGLRAYKWNTYYLNYFSFHSFYNAVLMGYYPAAGATLRAILETFVRLRYFDSVNGNAVDNEILLHYQDDPGYRRSHGVRAMFQGHGPSWYDHYKFLCAFTHCGLGAVTAINDLRTGVMPSTVLYSETSLRWMMDKSLPLLQAHIKALGMLVLGRATVPLRMVDFGTVITELSRFTGGTTHEAMIAELAPGNLPNDPPPLGTPPAAA